MTSTANTTGSSAYVIPPGQGDRYWAVGDLVTFKLAPAETGGKFVLAETEANVGMGPPPHRHGREDETFYVLDGKMQFLLEDDLFDAVPGDAFFLPRNRIHQFRNVGQTRARMLVMAAPCGFETFIPTFAIRAKPGEQPPAPTPDAIDKLVAACGKYDIELLPQHQPRNAPRPANTTKRSLWVLGLRVDLKLNGPDTGGAFSLATITAPPGGGPPAHSHTAHDELFYVERGAFEFLLGERAIRAESGTTVFVPSGTVHTFKNVGSDDARLVDLHFPGGFEDFFTEAGMDARTSSVPPPIPDAATLVKLLDKHGMKMPS
jgi:quercetin dioxygenase-like cupin family protein